MSDPADFQKTVEQSDKDMIQDYRSRGIEVAPAMLATYVAPTAAAFGPDTQGTTELGQLDLSYIRGPDSDWMGDSDWMEKSDWIEGLDPVDSEKQDTMDLGAEASDVTNVSASPDIDNQKEASTATQNPDLKDTPQTTIPDPPAPIALQPAEIFHAEMLRVDYEASLIKDIGVSELVIATQATKILRSLRRTCEEFGARMGYERRHRPAIFERLCAQRAYHFPPDLSIFGMITELIHLDRIGTSAPHTKIGIICAERGRELNPVVVLLTWSGKKSESQVWVFHRQLNALRKNLGTLAIKPLSTRVMEALHMELVGVVLESMH